MKDDSIQPTRISKEEYVKFKQWVQDTHGTTRGHLSTEIENALREYRKPDTKQDTLARIEDDIATIKANLATPESDGGTPFAEESTPAPDNTTNPDVSTTKPQTNAARKDKVDWIVSKYYDRSGGEMAANAIRAHVKNEWAFDDGVVDDYVELIVDELGAERHPTKQQIFAWGDVLTEARSEANDQACAEFEQIENATPTDS